jgi:hypothetical protein
VAVLERYCKEEGVVVRDATKQAYIDAILAYNHDDDDGIHDVMGKVRAVVKAMTASISRADVSERHQLGKSWNLLVHQSWEVANATTQCVALLLSECNLIDELDLVKRNAADPGYQSAEKEEKVDTLWEDYGSDDYGLDEEFATTESCDDVGDDDDDDDDDNDDDDDGDDDDDDDDGDDRTEVVIDHDEVAQLLIEAEEIEAADDEATSDPQLVWEGALAPHERQDTIDVLDTVAGRATAQLHHHEIKQVVYWGATDAPPCVAAAALKVPPPPRIADQNTRCAAAN